jgi:hypothetical protein
MKQETNLKVKIKGLTNRQMREHVQNKQSFINGNKTCFAEYHHGSGVYVVYSYGYHYPMYAFEPQLDVWFINTAKSSRTTARHKSHCHPRQSLYGLDFEQMRQLVIQGYSWVVDQRLKGLV